MGIIFFFFSFREESCGGGEKDCFEKSDSQDSEMSRVSEIKLWNRNSRVEKINTWVGHEKSCR